MRIFALELNNDIKGIPQRKAYIEKLIAALEKPDIILLPELALCSYMASQAAWEYADDCGSNVSAWAKEMAKKYHTYIGVGYLDYENGDYYNRYLIADSRKIYGVVSKSEGESAVFKRGWFDSIIPTPFGNVAVAICYDAKRKHFYNNIKDEEISLIVFPHGCPADSRKADKEIRTNNYFCEAYMKAFQVPVVYVNSVGKLEFMPGKMGSMMAKAGFRMNGRSKIYADNGNPILSGKSEVLGYDTVISPQRRKKDIRFYGNDIIKGNYLFRKLILEPDMKAGIRLYNERKEKN